MQTPLASETGRPMTTDLIERVRAGDERAFVELTEPHRRELHVHCYRMLGSLHDAEDVLQETLLAAWQGFATYEGRASIRTWLYRIATNRCLNARRAAGRRPPQEWTVPGIEPPPPSSLGEVVWLQPYPFDPEARYETTEAISLAFVTALQRLPPRQVAVLLLRDVLGFRASEVAAMLDTTVESVTSALKRARAGLRAGTAPVSDADPALLERFVHAYEASDVDGLVALLTDDVFLSMPPLALQYEGPGAVGAFFSAALRDRRFSLLETRANGGQPAFGIYHHAADGTRRINGVIVLTVAVDAVSAIARFDNAVVPWFRLPERLE
jgi:RNA polymerase sigma-70 factor (TIGR02960 family)